MRTWTLCFAALLISGCDDDPPKPAPVEPGWQISTDILYDDSYPDAAGYRVVPTEHGFTVTRDGVAVAHYFSSGGGVLRARRRGGAEESK